LPAVTTPTETDALRSSAEQVARSYFDAVAARDAHRMAEHWDAQGVDDIVPFGIFRGPDEIRGFFDELFAAVPDAETVVDRVIADDRTAVVQYRMRGNFTGGRSCCSARSSPVRSAPGLHWPL